MTIFTKKALKFLNRKHPAAYALDAIKELERQLLTARTVSRKKKLESRITQWKAHFVGPYPPVMNEIS